MQGLGARSVHPELRDLVVEASRALACLDATRLEELALSCALLNRELETADPARRREMGRQAREAQSDMAVFGRVLEATRTNLAVMKRIRELRAGRRIAYGEREAQPGTGHGDN
jgi:hypothetical protein